MTSKFLVRSLSAAALLAVSGASQAGITVYTSLASFNAAVGTTGTDTFAGFSIVGTTASPITRSAGPYSYTANPTPAGSFYGAGTTADPWLSTNTGTDVVTFNGFSPGVVAAGGNFFGTNLAGSFAAGSVSLTATDGSGSVTQVITGAVVSSFLGFVSDGPLLSLTLSSVQPVTGVLWPTTDNFVLAGAAAPVPEPQVYALLLAGLGFVGFMARRRRG